MRSRKLLIGSLVVLLGLIALHPGRVLAQDSMKQALVTFAFDLDEGMKRSTLTPDQKEQVRNDLKTLREAKQSGNKRAAFKAMMNFHRLLDSGAFQPQDAQRIKQDLRALREAKQASGGMGGMGGGGMGGGGMMGGNP